MVTVATNYQGFFSLFSCWSVKEEAESKRDTCMLTTRCYSQEPAFSREYLTLTNTFVWDLWILVCQAHTFSSWSYTDTFLLSMSSETHRYYIVQLSPGNCTTEIILYLLAWDITRRKCVKETDAALGFWFGAYTYKPLMVYYVEKKMYVKYSKDRSANTVKSFSVTLISKVTLCTVKCFCKECLNWISYVSPGTVSYQIYCVATRKKHYAKNGLSFL